MSQVGAQSAGAGSSPLPPAFAPALRALMACVGGDDAACAESLRQALAAGADLPRVALTHGLAPLLYRRVRQAGLEGLLPPAQWETLKTAHLRRARGQQALLEMAAEAVALLTRAAIPCLPIKGLALLATLGDEQLPREMADIDLLIPAAKIVPAARLLQDSGWAEAGLPWTLTPWTYGLPPLARADMTVELHWRLWPIGPLLPFDLPDFPALSAHARPTPWAGTELSVPDVPAQLLTVVAAMTVDALAVGLRYWADLYSLRQRLTGEEERRLWEMAAAAGMAGYLRVVLGLLEELWPSGRGTTPPGEATDTIRKIAWRRLTETPRAVRRASSLLLFWRRFHGAGKQLDPAWQEKLPPELRARARAEALRGAIAGVATAFVAGGKLLRRGVLWLADPQERLALREEIALAEALQSLLDAP